MRILLNLFLFLFATSFCFTAEHIPEFGSSVSFSEEGPTVKLSNLAGKVVVIVFFQEWCPKCNQWSGARFQDAEKAFGDDPSIVLIALKTDGGSVARAKEYLKNRLNTDKWIIASDKGAEYYKSVTGHDKLYHYAVVDRNGEIVTIDYFGATKLPQMNLRDSRYGKMELFLRDLKPSEPFRKAVRDAELGAYKSAYIQLKNLEKDKNNSEEAKDIQKKILVALDDKVDKLKKAIADESTEDRFLKLIELRNLIETLAGFKVQADVIASYNQFKAEPFFKKELAAENSYNLYLKNLQSLKKEDIDKYKQVFIPKYVKTYENTYYATIIQKELN